MAEEKKEGSVVPAEYLHKAFRERLKFWKTPSGDGFVDIYIEGVRHSVPVKSGVFGGILYDELDKSGKMPAKNAMDSFRAWCVGRAESAATIREAYYRVAPHDNFLYYDLGREDRKTVRIGEGKWEIVAENGPRFVRPAGALGQVLPTPTNKTLEQLLTPFLRTRTRSDLVLVIGWLLGALKSGGPFPVLVLNGPQGSTKSTTTRLLRAIIDPHTRPMRELTTNTRDLTATLRNGYVLAFDNISGVAKGLSDFLCLISTGGAAIGGRALYTDYDEAAFTACRPVILNGIPSFVERPDLADRAINIELPKISPEERKDESTFWRDFNIALPEILGALFNAVAHAQVSHAAVELKRLPRLADFAKWCYTILGDEFIDAYDENRQESDRHILEHDEVAQAIVAFMRERKEWSGTWDMLLADLIPHTPVRGEWWPKSTQQLQNRVKRVEPVLKMMGLTYYKNGRQPGTGKTMIEFQRSQCKT